LTNLDSSPQPGSPVPQDKERARKLLRARQQVAAIKCFYVHLIVFVPVIALLLAINLTTNSLVIPLWWVQWPFIGWGIFVAAHAFVVFRRPRKHGSTLVSNWEDRKIRKLMEEQ
jgi:hypothetical protein